MLVGVPMPGPYGPAVQRIQPLCTLLSIRYSSKQIVPPDLDDLDYTVSQDICFYRDEVSVT